MLILGIDPGTANLGWGILEEDNGKIIVHDYGCITTTKADQPSVRLKKIHQGLTKIISEIKPDCLSVEQIFFGANAKTAIAIGEARGVVLLAAAESNIPVAEYTPLQVKMSLTGYGRADKLQIQKMLKTLLKLDKIPKPSHAADALTLALCHANSRGFNKRIYGKTENRDSISV